MTTDDVRDPDHIPNRLVDLQNVYQEVRDWPLSYCRFQGIQLGPRTLTQWLQQKITDYPLISRAKSTKSFRDMLVGFFNSLVELLHETDVLYKDTDLMDNMHAWLGSMSSSSLRPFRHTATTISLAVQTGLVNIARVLDQRIAKIEQQLAAAKKSKNKSKTTEVQRSLNEANGSRKICSDGIQSFFDIVFVHRYRDVDSKIRTECVEALGTWIWDLPAVFMEPGYLRYLGWMLSDTNATTRQEVLKQLLRVFRRDASQLGHFIDRFRPRLVEMATLDSEVPVRVTAISVIETLRIAAMLEPNEIDAIGRLIFDTEIRIRRAVVNFFVACIDDVHENKMEEIGGAEALEELEDVEEDDYDSPRKEWVNIKCLAETLAIYDAQVEESQSGAVESGHDVLDGAAPDTRISLAAQVLYDKVPEVKTWEMIAGYLLFDHTTSSKTRSRSRSKAQSADATFKKAVAPTAAEESILLDVLSSAVKSNLIQTTDVDKGKRRLGRSEAAEAQEDVALELTTTIPKLLSKFGAEPETAAIVLRLERFLSLDTFQQLRQDASKYEKLLDEICTQFNRHDDKRVLTEATSALLHARQYEELEELTDRKLEVLWENVINALRNFDKSCELSVRGNLAAAPLGQLSTLLLKISKLASISDCVDALEAAPKGKDASPPAIDILSNIVHRGKYEPQEDEIDDLEDEVVTFAIKAAQFYFMWKTRTVALQLANGTGMANADLDRLSVLRQSYRRHLIETFSSRAAIDQLRLFATGSLCDLHLTFATLRPHIKNFRAASAAAAGRADKATVLIQDIEPGLVPELTSIFDGTERQYAKKANKTLNEPDDDENPVADDEDEDDDEDADLSKEERYAAELKAERGFCELAAKYVLAITAKLIDNRGSHAAKLRKRLLRNQHKLGNNFKEVVAYLDEDKFARRTKKAIKAQQLEAQPQKEALSLEIIDDDIFDDNDAVEGSREDLRRRELLEDDIIDDDDDEEDIAAPPAVDDDEILGD